MARPLAAIERFFERLFERPAARLFHTRLQPIQLQRRLERAMEADRRLSADRVYVPNRYRLLLHPQDWVGFQPFQASLESDLSEALLTRARSRRYTLLDRPRVALEPSDQVRPGDIVVDAHVEDPRAQPAFPAASPVGGPSGAGAPGPGAEGRAPAGMPPEVPEPAALAQTAVFAIPRTPPLRAVIAVRTPGGALTRVPLLPGTMRIGRSADNDLVLPDDRVSRYHGQLAARLGTLVYVDLGSTNGSWVNGSRVSEIAVGPGDVLQLGNSTLIIEPGA